MGWDHNFKEWTGEKNREKGKMEEANLE